MYFEQQIQKMGFTNSEEFNRMVAKVDISSPEKLAAFRKWQYDDGTKDGLGKLPVITTYSEG